MNSADADPLFFKRLALQLGFELESVSDRIIRLKSADYPTKTALAFLDDLRDETNQQHQDVQIIIGDYKDDPNGAFERLKSEHRKLTRRLDIIAAIEGAQTRSVPWSIVPTVERLGQSLISNLELLTCCIDRYSYEIMFWTKKSTPETLRAILFLPSPHRLNAFLHVVVAHELFHPLHDDFLDGRQPDVVSRLKAELLKNRGPKASSNPGQKGRLDQALEQARTIWRRGMEEVFCDLGDAAVFGPAAVFASHAFLLPYQPDQSPDEPDYYPPDRYRLRQVFQFAFAKESGAPAFAGLLQLLRNDPRFGNLADVVSRYWDGLKRFAAETSDQQALSSDFLTKIAYREVGNTLPEAWKTVEKMVDASGISWSKHLEQVPWHLGNLRDLVPSPEQSRSDVGKSQAGSVASIAIAAWFEEIVQRHSSNEPAIDPPISSYQRACRLLFKSVEDAELVGAYREREKKA
jgi:hypothetical protein